MLTRKQKEVLFVILKWHLITNLLPGNELEKLSGLRYCCQPELSHPCRLGIV